MSNIQAVLTLLDKNGNFRQVQVTDRICIGRKRAESRCELQLDSPIVSRIHGEIFRDGSRYYYHDLNSTNGVTINGKHYGGPTGEKLCELKDGDRISFEIRRGDQRHPESVDCTWSMRAAVEEPVAPAPEVTRVSNPIPEIPQPIPVPAPTPVQPASRPALRQAKSGAADLVVHLKERNVVQHFKKHTLLKDIRLSVSNGEMVLILVVPVQVKPPSSMR